MGGNIRCGRNGRRVRKVESAGSSSLGCEGAHSSIGGHHSTGSFQPAAHLPVACLACSFMAATMANTTSSLVEKWQENYHYVFTELRDPRYILWEKKN